MTETLRMPFELALTQTNFQDFLFENYESIMIKVGIFERKKFESGTTW